jgi:cation-transporting ATPase E
MNITTEFPGLFDADVKERIARGDLNRTDQRTSRPVGDILRANLFTRFNAILTVLLLITIALGSIRDALFGIVMVLNAAIGIVQELRAKWTLDRLSLLSAAQVTVMRNGKQEPILSDHVVLDDIVVIREGDQIVTDGVVLASEGLEVDEALLTGESEPVGLRNGDRVLSGSFVTAGEAVYRATAVGKHSFAAKLEEEARQFKVAHSELQASIETLLKWITVLMVPAAVALFVTENALSHSLDAAALATVSGLVGMIPQGLVLLTSMAFAISVIRLGRRRVLVQELPAVEALARVDVVCFDKTGTLTEGSLSFDRVEPLDESLPARAALGALAKAFSASPDSMMAAIATACPSPHWRTQATIPFSSERRWSAARFEGHGTWVMGAPEVLLKKVGNSEKAGDTFGALAKSGERLLLLAHTGLEITATDLPPLHAAAFVLLRERVRSDAPETLAFFAAQGVKIKVISGDHPLTVAAAARQAGLPGAERAVDASTMPEHGEELGGFMDRHTVFGRVQPRQKKAMVQALRARGHVVAMLGDGVNDVLAIKQADLGIAVGSGAPATKSVAQLVLVDGKFATLPHVVAEGRRVLANVERVANLFVTKTVYAALLVFIVSLLHWPFLLLPRHFTLIGAFTIGTPAFFLSLGPNTRRYLPGFLRRLLRFTIPAGAVLAAAVLVSVLLVRKIDPAINLTEERTVATVVLALLGLRVLMAQAVPLKSWRGILVAVMAMGFAMAILGKNTRTFFALDVPNTPAMLVIGIAVVVASAVLQAFKATGT